LIHINLRDEVACHFPVIAFRDRRRRAHRHRLARIPALIRYS